VLGRGRVLSPQARAFLQLLDPDFAQTAGQAGGHRNRRDRRATDSDFTGFDRSLP